MPHFLKIFFYSFLLVLLACQPFELGSVTQLSKEELKLLSQSDPASQPSKSRYSIRDRFIPEFKSRFLSNKLDMVFILDTGPGMKDFFKQNPFSSEFLTLFEEHDWRWAYTDMSVDIETLKQQAKKKANESESDSGCNPFSGLLLTGVGAVTGLAPVTSLGVLKIAGECFTGDDKGDKSSSDKPSYANGSFLPLEHVSQAIYQLSPSVPDYSVIFDKSMKISNTKKKHKYLAPILRKTQSYPMLSLILSLAKNLKTTSGTSFFREDSLIVFVLVSPQDIKMSLSDSKLKESLTQALGSAERFRLIPVSLTENSNIFCSLRLKYDQNNLLKLKTLAKELDQDILDVCSPNLGTELFNEVSKNLISDDFLKE